MMTPLSICKKSKGKTGRLNGLATIIFHAYFKELGVPTVIRFRAGYSKDAPVIECRVVITKGKGKEKWGAIPREMYYVLSIKKVKLINSLRCPAYWTGLLH